ncbi:MAG: glycosyltransferase [bacterium]
MRITIALPVLNEESVLSESAGRVLEAVRSLLPKDTVTVVVSDNGSDDRTAEIGQALAAAEAEVRYLRLEERGKGRAVFAAWESVPADVYAFTDIDLAADLSALPELVGAIRGGAGLSVGSRFHPASVVERSFGRNVYSYGYRNLLKATFGTAVSDVPCGLKAASASVVSEIVPQVRDRGWFFDTELLIRAERAGFDIHEIPVTWRETPIPGRESKVNAPRLAAEYLRRVMQLKLELK